MCVRMCACFCACACVRERVCVHSTRVGSHKYDTYDTHVSSSSYDICIAPVSVATSMLLGFRSRCITFELCTYSIASATFFWGAF